VPEPAGGSRAAMARLVVALRLTCVAQVLHAVGGVSQQGAESEACDAVDEQGCHTPWVVSTKGSDEAALLQTAPCDRGGEAQVLQPAELVQARTGDGGNESMQLTAPPSPPPPCIDPRTAVWLTCNAATPKCTLGCSGCADKCQIFDKNGQYLNCDNKINSCCARCYLWNNRSPKQPALKTGVSYHVNGPLILPDPELSGVEAIDSLQTAKKWDPLWEMARKGAKDKWWNKNKQSPEDTKQQYGWSDLGLHVNPAGFEPLSNKFRTMNTMHLHFKPMNAFGKAFAAEMVQRLQKVTCGDWITFPTDKQGEKSQNEMIKKMQSFEVDMIQHKVPILYENPKSKAWRYAELAKCKYISVKFQSQAVPFSEVWQQADKNKWNPVTDFAKKKNVVRCWHLRPIYYR